MVVVFTSLRFAPSLPLKNKHHPPIPQSTICGMGRKSIKPPKNPNDYKARNGDWEGVFGMAGNGVLGASECPPGASFPGGLPGPLLGLSRGVRGGGHRRADQVPNPLPGLLLGAAVGGVGGECA